MGALLNQSMFLILIGLMKGKTVAMIGQDFRNVSRPSAEGLLCAVLILKTGALRSHLRFVQGLADCQLL